MQQPDDILIEDCTAVDRPGWLEMRQALWPDCSRAQHLEEMRMWVADRGRYRQFLAYTRQSEPIGFIEASLRHDYVNGTLTSPVVFVEGLYVAPAFRRRGVARALMHAVRQWALALGCQELASDTDPGNTVSQATHRALGFEETERAVFFRMPLVRMPPDRG